MRTFFNNNKALMWVIIAMLVLNIAAFTTIIIQRKTQAVATPSLPRPFPGDVRPGIYLREELGLDDGQFAQFTHARDQYQLTARRTHLRLMEKRKDFLNALFEDNADSAFMKATSDSIGLLHARLIEETGAYYQTIRALCREDQVGKLNAFFSRVVIEGENTGMPHRGAMRGSRGRMENPRRNNF
jgi:hypothetical protein